MANNGGDDDDAAALLPVVEDHQRARLAPEEAHQDDAESLLEVEKPQEPANATFESGADDDDDDEDSPPARNVAIDDDDDNNGSRSRRRLSQEPTTEDAAAVPQSQEQQREEDDNGAASSEQQRRVRRRETISAALASVGEEEALAARCVKISWKRRPGTEEAFRAALAAVEVTYVRAKLRDKSAVVMFATSDEAQRAVAVVNHSNKDWTAALTLPLVEKKDDDQLLGRGASPRSSPSSRTKLSPPNAVSSEERVANRRAIKRELSADQDAAATTMSPTGQAPSVSARCIKVTWAKHKRPRDDKDFLATLAAMAMVPVSSKVRKNSAVVMFASPADARAAVDRILKFRDSNDLLQVGSERRSVRWSASVVADTLAASAHKRSLSGP
mmetsp:Transcript_22453/g.69120  ORF Transcript_22453/g.69120 Transcript_22453/m.69120 type:complete len:386 (+) Transcript_22453:20-1177(+)